MCYFIIERQLVIEYKIVIALFVLQKLDLKMVSNVLQTSKRQLFWELIYGHCTYDTMAFYLRQYLFKASSCLTLKAKIAADDILFFFNFYLLKKIRLDVLRESSAVQRENSHEMPSLIFSEEQ